MRNILAYTHLRRLWLISTSLMMLTGLQAQHQAEDSLLRHLHTLPRDTQQVAVYIQLANLFRYNDPLKSEQYAVTARDLAQSLHFISGEVHSTMLIGLVYRRKGVYPQALAYLTQALRLAEQHNLPRQVAAAQNNIGIVYWNMSSYPEALSYFKQALVFQRSVQNQEAVANILNNLGAIHTSLNNPDSSILYYEEALAIYTALNQPTGIHTVGHNLGIAWREKGNITRSNQLLAAALQGYLERQDIRGAANAAKNLGKNHLRQEMYASAEAYAKQALGYAQSQSAGKEEMESYELLANIAANQGAYQLALNYTWQYIGIRDTLFNQDKNRQIAEIKAQYETEKKVLELERLAAQARQRTYILGGGLGLVAAFLLALSWALYQRSLVSRARQQKLEEEKARLVAEEETQRLRAEYLEAELDFRNRELAAKAFHLIQKNEVLTEISADLRKIAEQASVAATPLRAVQRTIHSSMQADQDWDTFKLHFERVHGGFFDRLLQQHPALTAHDLRFCAYMRMNLSTKEIAILLHLSPRGVETNRYRLRKKLQLPSQQDLYQWMMQV
ncbi:MAG: tetratricopeptide repeat protein [Bacteroidia bacterium]|nr:tetratricopeptide repeat protein [Bacteroidia bacterium]